MLTPDTRSNLDALGFPVIIDDCQHQLTQPLGLNQVTELADRRLVWCRLIAKVNTYEFRIAALS